MPVKGKLGYAPDSESGFVLVKGKTTKEIVKIGVVGNGPPSNERGSVSVMAPNGPAAEWRGRLWVRNVGGGTGCLELTGPSPSSGGQAWLVRAGHSATKSAGAGGGQVTVHSGVAGSLGTATITLDGESGDIRAKSLSVDDVYAKRVIVLDQGRGEVVLTNVPPYSVVATNLHAANKDFAVPHPTDPRTDIHYGALEGPEAPIFTRGRLKLRRGRGSARLPGHFSLLAKRGSLTCSVTSLSSRSKGVSVDLLAPDRIRVRENAGGRGSYAVDYVVFAERMTTPPFRVMRPAVRARPDPRPRKPRT